MFSVLCLITGIGKRGSCIVMGDFSGREVAHHHSLAPYFIMSILNEFLNLHFLKLPKPYTMMNA